MPIRLSTKLLSSETGIDVRHVNTSKSGVGQAILLGCLAFLCFLSAGVTANDQVALAKSLLVGVNFTGKRRGASLVENSHLNGRQRMPRDGGYRSLKKTKKKKKKKRKEAAEGRDAIIKGQAIAIGSGQVEEPSDSNHHVTSPSPIPVQPIDDPTADIEPHQINSDSPNASSEGGNSPTTSPSFIPSAHPSATPNSVAESDESPASTPIPDASDFADAPSPSADSSSVDISQAPSLSPTKQTVELDLSTVSLPTYSLTLSFQTARRRHRNLRSMFISVDYDVLLTTIVDHLNRVYVTAYPNFFGTLLQLSSGERYASDGVIHVKQFFTGSVSFEKTFWFGRPTVKKLDILTQAAFKNDDFLALLRESDDPLLSSAFAAELAKEDWEQDGIEGPSPTNNSFPDDGHMWKHSPFIAIIAGASSAIVVLLIGTCGFRNRETQEDPSSIKRTPTTTDCRSGEGSDDMLDEFTKEDLPYDSEQAATEPNTATQATYHDYRGDHAPQVVCPREGQKDQEIFRVREHMHYDDEPDELAFGLAKVVVNRKINSMLPIGTTIPIPFPESERNNNELPPIPQDDSSNPGFRRSGPRDFRRRTEDATTESNGQMFLEYILSYETENANPNDTPSELTELDDRLSIHTDEIVDMREGTDAAFDV